jgi:hypothetical protein
MIFCPSNEIKGWRYQSCNQKPHNEEVQTKQWPNETGQKDKPWSTKHYTDLATKLSLLSS